MKSKLRKFMNKPFNENPDKESVRAKIMGLGKKPAEKAIIPARARIMEAEESRLNLQKKSSDLLVTHSMSLNLHARNQRENEKKIPHPLKA